MMMTRSMWVSIQVFMRARRAWDRSGRKTAWISIARTDDVSLRRGELRFHDDGGGSSDKGPWLDERGDGDGMPRRHLVYARLPFRDLPAPAKVLSCRTAPCAYVPKLITEGSPACPRSPAAGYPRALRPAAREQMPASAAQPRTAQVADKIANTPQNTRVRPPRSCYSYCMISPTRGNRTGFRVQVPRTR